MKKAVYQQLKLPHLEAVMPHLIEQAREESWTYETFLERALTSELEGREQKALARRLKSARIPANKTLSGFDFAFQPTVSERRMRELADLSFVRTCTNVIFLGPPGTGKPQPTIYPHGNDGTRTRNGDRDRPASSTVWAVVPVARNRHEEHLWPVLCRA